MYHVTALQTQMFDSLRSGDVFLKSYSLTIKWFFIDRGLSSKIFY